MLYAILCYNDEKVTGAWSKEEDEAVMARLGAVQERLTKDGRLGPVARLAATTEAKTLRKTAADSFVVDGPFAETKEQFLGFYLAEFASIEEALDWARELAAANPGPGGYEIRPVSHFFPAGAPA